MGNYRGKLNDMFCWLLFIRPLSSSAKDAAGDDRRSNSHGNRKKDPFPLQGSICHVVSSSFSVENEGWLPRHPATWDRKPIDNGKYTPNRQAGCILVW